MYRKCEKLIKILAAICPILSFVGFASILPIIDCLDMESYLLGDLFAVIIAATFMGVIGAVIGYLCGAFVYGFAEIVENVKKIEK